MIKNVTEHLDNTALMFPEKAAISMFPLILRYPECGYSRYWVADVGFRIAG